MSHSKPHRAFYLQYLVLSSLPGIQALVTALEPPVSSLLILSTHLCCPLVVRHQDGATLKCFWHHYRYGENIGERAASICLQEIPDTKQRKQRVNVRKEGVSEEATEARRGGRSYSAVQATKSSDLG